MIDYPFTQEEADDAYEAWGCNCGPAALAFLLGVKPAAVRHSIPHFEERRYTSPSMMKAALAKHGFGYRIGPGGRVTMCREEPALCRIQWTGPWTAPGADPRWAYRQTHWLVCWREGTVECVFDVNGGVMTMERWERELVPALVATVPRADGNWYATHVWRLK